MQAAFNCIASVIHRAIHIGPIQDSASGDNTLPRTVRGRDRLQ